MTIIVNGRRFDPYLYKLEKDFEDEVIKSAKILFGKATIYIDAKKKIESKNLGAVVPDGFFFDFSDPTDPQFYIVEVELSQHGFYGHIFPQITKFFAFFNNTKMQKSLVDKLFSIIDTDTKLRAEFRKHLGHSEVYKFLSDIIESSQNILLVADNQIVELPEIMGTYTDTWGRMVRFVELRKYTSDEDIVYSITPDIETLQYAEAAEVGSGRGMEEIESPYSEDFHLEKVAPVVRDIYKRIKQTALNIDPTIIFNPQKYYISIKAPKNIAYIKIRKKKVRFIVMMPEKQIRDIVKTHLVIPLSQPVQTFYNGPCAAVDISNIDSFDEIEFLVQELITINRHSPKQLDGIYPLVMDLSNPDQE
jgi:predicted transport protein